MLKERRKRREVDESVWKGRERKENSVKSEGNTRIGKEGKWLKAYKREGN